MWTWVRVTAHVHDKSRAQSVPLDCPLKSIEGSKRLFLSMAKMAPNAHDFYGLPSNRVIELGQQITL